MLTISFAINVFRLIDQKQYRSLCLNGAKNDDGSLMTHTKSELLLLNCYGKRIRVDHIF